MFTGREEDWKGVFSLCSSFLPASYRALMRLICYLITSSLTHLELEVDILM